MTAVSELRRDFCTVHLIIKCGIRTMIMCLIFSDTLSLCSNTAAQLQLERQQDHDERQQGAEECAHNLICPDYSDLESLIYELRGCKNLIVKRSVCGHWAVMGCVARATKEAGWRRGASSPSLDRSEMVGQAKNLRASRVAIACSMSEKSLNPCGPQRFAAAFRRLEA